MTYVKQYRIEHNKVFKLDDEQDAYVFIGFLHGRTLAKFISDREDAEFRQWFFGDDENEDIHIR